MMRGLLRLTWIELKIFIREPLGALGTVFVPVLVFVALGKLGARVAPASEPAASSIFKVDVPVFAAVLIAINAVLSLVSIISIYREGGILKRLRATPLRPQTILTAQVLVKVILTVTTLILTLLAGKRYFPIGPDAPVFSFTVALLISTIAILSIGFLIASIVPTARFATSRSLRGAPEAGATTSTTRMRSSRRSQRPSEPPGRRACRACVTSIPTSPT